MLIIEVFSLKFFLIIRMKNRPLLKSLRPLNLICSLVGLSPYTLTKKGTLTTTIWANFVTILSFFCQILVLYIMNKYFTLKYWKYETLLELTLQLRSQIWKTITMCCIIVEFLHRKSTVNVLNNLQDLDNDLKIFIHRYSVKINLLDIKKSSVRWFLVLTLYTLSLMYYENANEKMTVGLFLFSIVMYFLLNLTVPIFLYKFIMLNFLVRERIGVVNVYLDSVRESDMRVSEF